MTNQTGYIVYATDSVGTALGEIEPGAIRLLGEPATGTSRLPDTSPSVTNSPCGPCGQAIL